MLRWQHGHSWGLRQKRGTAGGGRVLTAFSHLTARGFGTPCSLLRVTCPNDPSPRTALRRQAARAEHTARSTARLCAA
jgi:hypothetical protein